MSSSNGVAILGSTESEVEVLAKATRRRSSADYEVRILREAEMCTQIGEIGALLLRDGLYSSDSRTWRAQRQLGELDGLVPKKQGSTPKAKNPWAALPMRPGQGEGGIHDYTRYRTTSLLAHEDRQGNWCMSPPALGGRVPQVPGHHRAGSPGCLGRALDPRQLRSAHNLRDPPVAPPALAVSSLIHSHRRVGAQSVCMLVVISRAAACYHVSHLEVWKSKEDSQ